MSFGSFFKIYWHVSGSKALLNWIVSTWTLSLEKVLMLTTFSPQTIHFHRWIWVFRVRKENHEWKAEGKLRVITGKSVRTIIFRPHFVVAQNPPKTRMWEKSFFTHLSFFHSSTRKNVCRFRVSKICEFSKQDTTT